MREREIAEKAIQFLADTDKQVVELERRYKDLEHAYKETKAAIYKCSEAKTEGLRKADSETASETKRAWEASQDAWQEWRNLHMRRERANMRWDDWRSINSARKQGQVL